MGLSTTVAAGIAGAVTTFTPAPAADTTQNMLDRGAMTTTFDVNEARQSLQTSSAFQETSATGATQARTVGAEPPAQETSGGGLMKRRADREAGKPPAAPATEPTSEAKPASAPAAEPTAAKPSPEQPQVATPAPATPAPAAEVKPTSEVASSTMTLASWRPLSEDQIAKLKPEEVQKLLANEPALRREAAVTNDINQQMAEFYSNVRDRVQGNKEAGVSEQLKSLSELRRELGDQAKENGEMKKNLEDQRKDRQSELKNGIPVTIVDAVREENNRRQDLLKYVADRKNDFEIARDYTYVNLKEQRDYYARAKQNVILPEIRLPDFGIFREKQAEKSPKEVEAERQKVRAEFDKDPVFEPYKQVKDPLKADHLVEGTKPLDEKEIAQQVLNGVIPVANQRFALSDLSAHLDQQRAVTMDTERTIADAKQGMDLQSQDPRVREEVATLAQRKLEIATARAQLRYELENPPQLMNDMAHERLRAAMGVAEGFRQVAEGEANDIVNNNNLLREKVEANVNKDIDAKRADYEKFDKAVHNPVGAVIDGIFGPR
ncbi:MAG: hypothetical protein J0M12_02900 [Deltaproteobacteria bacterium]|nr:hypothetical protein [Deltaproteobacteria bacterium]